MNYFSKNDFNVSHESNTNFVVKVSLTQIQMYMFLIVFIISLVFLYISTGGPLPGAPGQASAVVNKLQNSKPPAKQRPDLSSRMTIKETRMNLLKEKCRARYLSIHPDFAEELRRIQISKSPVESHNEEM